MKNVLSLIVASLAVIALLIAGELWAQDVRRLNPFKVSVFSNSKEYPELYKEYRETWLRLTGFEISALHWNQFVVVFINQHPEVYRKNYIEHLKVSQDYEDEEEDSVGHYTSYPVGTMLAKEGFESVSGRPGEPVSLVIMKKRESGYDLEYGDWQYFKFSPNGETLLQGNSKNAEVKSQCINCHLNVSDSDFVFTSYFSARQ